MGGVNNEQCTEPVVLAQHLGAYSVSAQLQGR